MTAESPKSNKCSFIGKGGTTGSSPGIGGSSAQTFDTLKTIKKNTKKIVLTIFIKIIV